MAGGRPHIVTPRPAPMRSWLVGVLVLGVASSAAAQEPLTWTECVKEAVEANPDLAAARASVEQSRAQLSASYGPLLPQLAAAADYDKSKGATGKQSASLTAKQTVFSGFRNEAAARKARADLAAAEASLAAVKSQVGFSLKTAFAQLLFAQETARLTEAIASRRQENVRLVELRYEGGREHLGSFQRSRALYRQADFEVAQAARALRTAQRQLAAALGRRQDGGLVAGETLRVTPPTEVPDILALAVATPARRRAEAAANAAQAGVTIARSELFPDVAVSGTLSQTGGHWPPDHGDWSTAVALSFPFWPGGQNVFDLRAAQAQQRNAQAALRSAEQQAALDLESAFAALQDGVQKIAIQRGFLEAAQTRAEIARSQYTIGLLSFQDWDQIESDLITNQKAMLSTVRDAVSAEAAWERTQGKGVIP